MGWKRGDLIMTAQPYVHVLCNSSREERCSSCFQRQEKIKKCTACNILRYCGRECQKQDWPVHRAECKSLQKVAPKIPTDSVMLMLRILVKLQLSANSKITNPNSCQRTFQQLMSHVDEIKQDVDRCDAFSKVSFTLLQLTGPHLEMPDMESLLHIFGQMVINTFTIADEELKVIGSGIYLDPSVLDHSCTPNAVVSFKGVTLNVRAVEDIPDGKMSKVGSTVFISYVDQLAPSGERQGQLQRQYYFTCQCARCLDSALDNLMTSASEDSSDKENEELMLRVNLANKLCQTTVENVDQIKKTSGDQKEILEICRQCLRKVERTLSEMNVYKVSVLDRAFDAAVTCSCWDEAAEYGLQTIQPYRKLLSEYSPARGLQLMRVGKLLLFLNKLDEAHMLLVQAERIIAVTHGKGSELYRQLVLQLKQTSIELEQPAIE